MGKNKNIKINVPIPFGKPLINKSEIELIKKTINSNILVHGPKSIEFEKKFRNFTKSKYAISVSNCTTGMNLIYFSLGIGKGDEVIVPAQTHIATAHAVEYTGAKAVFADCDIKTGNISLDQIKKKINNRTKAICIVHFLGIPVDIKPIKNFAKKNNLFLIEDCALALGSNYYGKHVGTLGDAGVFSFYPVKHITTGEGGMIITNKKKLAKRLKLSRAFGVNKNYRERKKPGLYNSNQLGINFRMSEIHCSLGSSQIDKVKRFLNIRKNNFEFLVKNLKSNNNISIIDSDKKYLKNSHYCLTIILKKNLRKKRDKIIKDLNTKGIGTSIYYPHPLPRMNYYKNKYKLKLDNFKNARIISDFSIALPVGPHISSSQVKKMSNIINSVLSKYE